MFDIKKIFSVMMAAAAFALPFASCSDSAEEPQAPAAGEESQWADVTFTIYADTESPFTRAGEGGPAKMQTIGKAKYIDRLIYAVYDEDLTLLSQYGNTETGQYEVLDLGDTFKKGEAYNLELRLMRGKTYHITFWAQSSLTDAYDTRDFKRVEVKYPGTGADGLRSTLNNDEYRDAYCKTETLSINPQDESARRPVILSRPLAQVNVGTTGSDVQMIRSRGLITNGEIRQTQITLKGVARFFNVVEDIIDANNLADVTFDYSEIPSKYSYTPEEYLFVDVNGDGNYLPYITTFPTLQGNTPRTETFKYLSMCYVLVPASPLTAEENLNYPSYGDGYDTSTTTYTQALLDEMEVLFAYDPKTDDRVGVLRITNVPVHRNWRTNILGGLTTSGNGVSIVDSSQANVALFPGL